MATAGAAIASVVAAEGATSPAAETAVDVLMQPIVGVAHRQCAVAIVALAFMPQPRVVAPPTARLMPQPRTVARRMVRPMLQPRTAAVAGHMVAANIARR